MNKINYQANWGKLYISLGVLFGLLFILGGLILKDFTIFLNIIAAFVVIYMGYGMLKKPSATYDVHEIIVYSVFGSVRYHYAISLTDKLRFEKDKVYLNDKKLKLNSWMIDQKDWQRFREFYDENLGLMSELQEN